MGKEKNDKKKNRAKNPAGLPPRQSPGGGSGGGGGGAMSEPKDDDGYGGEAEVSGSIADMVESASASDRSTACATYTMLFEGIANRGNAEAAGRKGLKGDRRALARLLGGGVAEVLTRLLGADPEPSVRAHAAEAMRAMLAAMGAVDAANADAVAAAGLAAGVLHTVAAQVDAFATAATASSPSAGSNVEALGAILQPALATLVELLHLSPAALGNFNGSGLDRRILSLVGSAAAGPPGGCPGTVLRAAAQVLHVGLESNPALAAQWCVPDAAGVTGREALAAALAALGAHAAAEAPGDGAVHFAAAHLSGACVNLHLSLAGVAASEGAAQGAATAGAVLGCLLAQLDADAALPPMPAQPEAPPPAAAAAMASAPPPDQGYKQVPLLDDSGPRAAWASGVARLLLVLEVLNDLGEGGLDDDANDSDGEWGSDDEASMEMAAAMQTAARGDGGSADGGARRACLVGALGEARRRGAARGLVAFLEQLLRVPHSHGLAAAFGPVALLSDVCDLRAHTCLVLSRLAPCFAPPDAPPDAALEAWAALAAAARCGLEEALRLGAAARDVTGPWLAALGNAMVKLLHACPALGAGPAAGQPAASASGAAAVGGGPAALLRMVAARGPTPDTRALAVKCLAILAGRWLRWAHTAGGAGTAGGDGAQCQQLASEAVGALLGAMEDDVSPLVVADALDAAMDLFGEDDAYLHAAYVAGRCHARMAAAVASLRAKLKSKSDDVGRDDVQHCKEVLLNAQRFAKYKAKFGV